MPEKNSSFQWSSVLWILGWPATWLALLLYQQYITNPSWFLASPVEALVVPWNVASLLLFGFQIVGSILLVKAADRKAIFFRLTGAFFCGLFGLTLSMLYYCAVPSYEVPFLNDPNWRLVMHALVLWQAVGLIVLFKTDKFWTWVVTVACFSLPLALLVRIGPYIVLQNKCSEARFAELMARPDFIALARLDFIFIVIFAIVACATYPNIWTKLFRLPRKTAQAS
jgi:hypothetical protein